MIRTTRREPLPVRAEDHCVDGRHGIQAVIGPDRVVWLTVRRLPKAHRAIMAGRREPFAIRAEGYGTDTAGVALEHLDFLARGGIPELEGVLDLLAAQRDVAAAGSNQSAIRTEGHAIV